MSTTKQKHAHNQKRRVELHFDWAGDLTISAEDLCKKLSALAKRLPRDGKGRWKRGHQKRVKVKFLSPQNQQTSLTSYIAHIQDASSAFIEVIAGILACTLSTLLINYLLEEYKDSTAHAIPTNKPPQSLLKKKH